MKTCSFTLHHKIAEVKRKLRRYILNLTQKDGMKDGSNLLGICEQIQPQG